MNTQEQIRIDQAYNNYVQSNISQNSDLFWPKELWQLELGGDPMALMGD